MQSIASSGRGEKVVPYHKQVIHICVYTHHIPRPPPKACVPDSAVGGAALPSSSSAVAVILLPCITPLSLSSCPWVPSRSSQICSLHRYECRLYSSSHVSLLATTSSPPSASSQSHICIPAHVPGLPGVAWRDDGTEGCDRHDIYSLWGRGHCSSVWRDWRDQV